MEERTIMSLQRTALPEADRRFIIGRSAGSCNKCRMRVFVENEFGERARLADDAHIYAYSADGPRGDSPGAPANPNDRGNIILLCKTCHSEVDQQPLQYTPAVLTSMREEHYAWADARLGQDAIEKPRFRYILYLNLIRTDLYAVASSILPPQLDLGTAQRFSDLGIGAGRVMANYTHIFNNEELYGRQIAPDDRIDDLIVGDYCFIEEANFRTVAIGKSRAVEQAWARDQSVIYRDCAGWRLICAIDPRWITTNTAGVTLESGHARLCGVVRINRIDDEAHKVYASPLFLAQP
ncbi:hypothetical protein ACG3SL_19690 [Sphingomonas sp. CJ20]